MGGRGTLAGTRAGKCAVEATIGFHVGSTEVIQVCGLNMWITMWVTSGETGDKRWATTAQRGGVHSGPSAIPCERTAPVRKKRAMNWGEADFPSLHSPYDYDVLT